MTPAGPVASAYLGTTGHLPGRAGARVDQVVTMTSTVTDERAARDADEGVVHVLWMNGGLSCDGDSVALTAATQPSSGIIGAWPATW